MKRNGLLIILSFLALAAACLISGCGSSVDNKGSSSSASILVPSSTEYPNADLLVWAGSVEDNLSNPDLLVIDARGKAAYDQGHIPGAINLIHNDFWTWGSGLKPVEELEALLGEAGLTRDMTVVVYDNTTAAWGAAGRIFWMLEYLGCNDVHILNGGWDKWIADGRPTETRTNALIKATFTASVKDAVRATKESILAKEQSSDFVLIDARTDEEYNGWQIYGEARGGHIPGAVQIPYAWFFNSDKTVLSYADLKTLLETRGVTADKEVASNCTVGIRSGFVYFALRLMGYPSAANYDASIIEWAAADETAYPMDKMANYHMLVYPGWIEELIAGGTPPTFESERYVILETESTSPNLKYNTGHIPGAIHVGTRELTCGADVYTCPAEANLPPDPQLQTLIEELGITRDTTVVVYGYGSSSNYFRVAWALMYAGVEDVRVLNGGYEAWSASGGGVETTPNIPIPIADFGAVVPVHPEYLATTAEIQEMLSDPHSVVVDIRSWEEHTGEDGGTHYNFFTAAGHIPGDVYAENSGWYFDADKTLRSYPEVEQMWQDRGITSDKMLAFY